MNFYSIYFTRNGQVVRLPHNPEKLPEDKASDNGDYNILGIGAVTVPRTPKQRVIKISSYFPATVTSSLTSLLTYRSPEYYIKFFQSAMDDKEPILYTPVRIDERGIPYAMSYVGYYVMVTGFSAEERGGETGDFYYDLECTEWRNYSPTKVQVASTTTTSTASTGASTSSLLSAARAAATVAAASSMATTIVKAVVEPSRSIPSGQIVVGSTAKLSGYYYRDAQKGEPKTEASGLAVTVARIESSTSAKAPVLLRSTDGGLLGWAEKASLTGVQNAN